MDYKEKLVERKDVLLRTFREKKGFTLIELIVVMSIMAILLIVTAPMFLNYTKDAKVTSMEADVRVIHDATMQYHIANKEWPVDFDGGSEVVIYKDNTATEAKPTHNTDIYRISEGVLDEFVSPTSSPISDYGIIYKPGEDYDLNGTILYTGKSSEDKDNYVEDKEGNKRIGVNGAMLVPES